MTVCIFFPAKSTFGFSVQQLKQEKAGEGSQQENNPLHFRSVYFERHITC